MNPAGLALALAMLYGAPVGAGLTGSPFGWGVVFAAIYLAYALFFRTTKIPALGQVLTAANMGKLIPTVVVQLILGTALILLGTQLRVWLGLSAVLPTALWLALCCAGVLVGRAAMGPWANAERDDANLILDNMTDALARLESTKDSVEEAASLPPPSDSVTDLLTRLGALPAEGVAIADLQNLVEKVPSAEIDTAFAHLNHRARDGRGTDLRAYVVAAYLHNPSPEMQKAFERIFDAGHTQALQNALVMANWWLDDDENYDENSMDQELGIAPNWTHLPAPARLTRIAGDLETDDPELAEMLVRTANRIEDLEHADD